jgi:hypothetical protein
MLDVGRLGQRRRVPQEAERLSWVTWTYNPVLPNLAMKYAAQAAAFRQAHAVLVKGGPTSKAAYRVLERHPDLVANPGSAPAPRRSRSASRKLGA